MDGVPAIRFIDPVVFKICLPIWDTDGDGYISENEANASDGRTIPQNAFNGRSDITSLDDLVKFAGYTFYGNFANMPNLETASIGYRRNGPNILPYQAFMDDISLKRVTLNPYIEFIERLSFRGCIALKTIEWGGNEKEISQDAFSRCIGLTKIELPDSITIIKSTAFSDCTELVDVKFSSNIRSIGTAAFYNCKKLCSDVDLPNLEEISGRAFTGSAIRHVRNLGKITSFTEAYSVGAFNSCPSLLTVILPATLESICKDAFSGCKLLEWVKLNSITPPVIDSTSFLRTNCVFYVPDSSINAYKAATNWTSLANRIKPISEFKE